MPDDAPKKSRIRPVVSAALPSGELLEMVYDPTALETGFILDDGAAWRAEKRVELSGVTLVPYSPANNLLTHRVVLFPSAPEEYGSEEDLFRDVRDFIHRYVDLSDSFEEVAAAYVLFSWVYDAFNEVPYLRVRGDYGTGKSRFLLTVGSLCYKPIFASGASTVSPIFRILDAVQGTLVIDEGDFRASDEKAEIIKILNNGNARGFPVLRSEQTPTKEFNPRAFHVFGPKLVATRNLFEDRALESRCLSEDMGTRPLRAGIPINLPESFEEEARELRNKLLLYRLRTRRHRRPLAEASVPSGLEPRLSQILLPLLATVPSEETRARLLSLARRSGQVLSAERAMAIEAEVLCGPLRAAPGEPAALGRRDHQALRRSARRRVPVCGDSSLDRLRPAPKAHAAPRRSAAAPSSSRPPSTPSSFASSRSTAFRASARTLGTLGRSHEWRRTARQALQRKDSPPATPRRTSPTSPTSTPVLDKSPKNLPSPAGSYALHLTFCQVSCDGGYDIHTITKLSPYASQAKPALAGRGCVPHGCQD